MVLLRSMVTYVGDWETGDLGGIHVVRPASGPKIPHKFLSADGVDNCYSEKTD